ncbi:RHS repeat-associated core domain-containing protein, partial [Lysobacter pythonis]
AKQQVIWLENYPIAVIDGSGAAANIGYIEPDHLGTPRVIIDAKRNVATWRWPLTGEAFGADAPEEDPDGDGERYEFDLRFPGQRYDRHTGLHYNYFRDYEPQTGRYVQSDPIGLSGGINTYAYVKGDPISFVDPLGLEGVGHWNNGSMDNVANGGEAFREMYETSRQWRTWGHQTFPGERNSAMRHCAVSCVLSVKLGSGVARAAGVTNEAQGLAMHDIPNLRSRIRGESPWACQASDLADNERGFRVGNSLSSGLSDSQLTQSCMQGCAGN